MDTAALIYITISVIILVIIGIFLIIRGLKRNEKRQTSGLTLIGMLLVISGILFGGSQRQIGYSLIGIGVLLSVIDVILIARPADKKDEKKKPRDHRRPRKRFRK